jgi:hypothetical protein
MEYIEQQHVARNLLLAEIEKNKFECDDNHRIALKGDAHDEARYQHQQQSGCCGEFDTEVEVDGVTWKIGCNYGH